MKYFIFQQREPRGRKYRESLQILLSSGTPYHRLRTPACKSCRLLESPAGAAPAVYKGCNAPGKGHFGFVTYDRVPCKSLRPRHLREMPPPPQCSLSRGGKIKWRYMCLNVYSFTATLQAYQAPKLQILKFLRCRKSTNFYKKLCLTHFWKSSSYCKIFTMYKFELEHFCKEKKDACVNLRKFKVHK